jgi:hypothetical protein
MDARGYSSWNNCTTNEEKGQKDEGFFLRVRKRENWPQNSFKFFKTWDILFKDIFS